MSADQFCVTSERPFFKTMFNYFYCDVSVNFAEIFIPARYIANKEK